ncbi:hypothetical protein K3555_09110 [Leisingera sp. M527]|uniref:hypothetical protein n=1 Tax=Leisingera sp. M527 TaxID=2867014 RepID=UPI0021A4BEFD|nr:hypothetical protein [Leisingera sp. M527]UWQ34622.1 hypothetical protein K3555_09110 [Leisingera sp. M527]
MFIKRKDKPRPKEMPLMPLDGKHPELEAELKLEKQERLAEMGAGIINKYLNRF